MAEEELKIMFSDAYDQFSDAIFRHCYFRVFDRELAKNFMQETFLKTWQYLADGKTIDNVRAFLYRTATNLIIDGSRKKKEESLDQLQESGFEPSFDPEHSFQAHTDVELLKKYLEQLSPSDREIILMRYLDDMSPQEISDTLHESANVVSVRINRALKKLRTLLNTPSSLSNPSNPSPHPHET